MGHNSHTSASNEIANYMHWHWMLDNQFRLFHRLHNDIDHKLKILNGLASNIESEITSITRINFIKKMIEEVRGLLDELSLLEKKERDMLLLTSVPFAKINIEMNESFASEVEYFLTVLRTFYQKTLRMTPLPNKKEAKELSRCLRLTIQPIENHIDRIEKDWYPAILDWLQ